MQNYPKSSEISQFSSVAQSCLPLCDPWTVAHQASQSITNSWSLLKLAEIPRLPQMQKVCGK